MSRSSQKGRLNNLILRRNGFFSCASCENQRDKSLTS